MGANKLAVDTRLTLASGTVEREATLEMLGGLPGEVPQDLGRGQELQYRRFCCGLPRNQRLAARGAEHL